LWGRPRTRCRTIDFDAGDVADALREVTDGEAPASVIAAVGMEAYGAPIGKLAHDIPEPAAGRDLRTADGKGRVDR